MATISFDNISKRFGDVTAVDGLDLDVADGELLVLLGPSGCGKTTALRMVAGLEDPSVGQIRIGERVVNDVDPKDRDVAMVFQGYALYPHLTAARNLEFPLRQRGIERTERLRRVNEVAETLGLTAELERKPGQLSGGQRQRVALGRAMVRDPQVFLMDEPLSNLDAALRAQTRADIVSLQRSLGTTTLYVTHDQVEAMTMGHRIAVMASGRLQQVATPHDLYNHPANVFVARFLGSPGMNVWPGQLDGHGPAAVARVAGGMVPLGDGGGGGVGDVSVGVRPEGLRVDPAGTIAASVDIVEMLGAEAHVIAHLEDGSRLVVRQDSGAARPTIGDSIRVSVEPGAAHLFDADSGARIGAVGVGVGAGGSRPAG